MGIPMPIGRVFSFHSACNFGIICALSLGTGMFKLLHNHNKAPQGSKQLPKSQIQLRPQTGKREAERESVVGEVKLRI